MYTYVDLYICYIYINAIYFNRNHWFPIVRSNSLSNLCIVSTLLRHMIPVKAFDKLLHSKLFINAEDFHAHSYVHEKGLDNRKKELVIMRVHY